MQVYGREIKFRRTVGATCDIADLCPDKDIANLGDVMNGGSTRDQFRAMCGFVAALNKGYEDAAQFEDKSYVKRPLTFDELSTLSPEELSALFVEAMETFNADAETTVETEKKREPEAGESA